MIALFILEILCSIYDLFHRYGGQYATVFIAGFPVSYLPIIVLNEL